MGCTHQQGEQARYLHHPLKIDADPVALAGGIGVLRDHRRLTRTATASTTCRRLQSSGVVLANGGTCLQYLPMSDAVHFHRQRSRARTLSAARGCEWQPASGLKAVSMIVRDDLRPVDPDDEWSRNPGRRDPASQPGTRAIPGAVHLEPGRGLGALGDLGTFLPHIMGAITGGGHGHPPASSLTFGLFYALSGAFYGIPMAVQPMKAASAAVLIQPMDPGSVAGAGLVIGAFFLILSASGLIGRVARALPPAVAAGLQARPRAVVGGTGHSPSGEEHLARPHGLRSDARPHAVPDACRWRSSPWLEAACSERRRASRRRCRHWPWAYTCRHLVWPNWAQMWNGVENAVLPQIPLTLTNAIIVTAAVSR